MSDRIERLLHLFEVRQTQQAGLDRRDLHIRVKHAASVFRRAVAAAGQVIALVNHRHLPQARAGGDEFAGPCPGIDDVHNAVDGRDLAVVEQQPGLRAAVDQHVGAKVAQVGLPRRSEGDDVSAGLAIAGNLNELSRGECAPCGVEDDVAAAKLSAAGRNEIDALQSTRTGEEFVDEVPLRSRRVNPPAARNVSRRRLRRCNDCRHLPAREFDRLMQSPQVFDARA